MCAEITKKEVEKQFYNGAVLMKLVPYKGQDTDPNGVAFYINNGQGGVIGVRVYPDGRKVAVNPTTNITDGTKSDRNRGQRYLLFTQAWGHGKAIYASHAVYTAWREKPIPAGMTIDHIDGVAQNNDVRNLRCISYVQNIRDGGFLSKLRHKGFNPACIDRAYLLRFYDRMAYIKDKITNYRYRRITKEQIRSILFLPAEELQIGSLILTLKKPKKIMPNDIKKLRRLMRTAHILQADNDIKDCGKSFALKRAWWFETFREALSNGFARFTYYKMDGTPRTALGTRAPSLIPIDKLPGASPQRNGESGLRLEGDECIKAIPYFDLEKEEWRSFNVLHFICIDKVWRFNDPIA